MISGGVNRAFTPARLGLRMAFPPMFARFLSVRLTSEDLEWQPTETARGFMARQVEL